MSLQQLETVPKELLVDFDGATSLVRPKVEYLGREARKMPVLAKQDGLEQLYTDSLVPIYKGLRAGTKDGYFSLAKRQPLVEAGKLSKDSMVDILSRFGDEVFNKYWIWVELLDWQPEKRQRDYKLLNGTNAVLYRNWDLSGETHAHGVTINVPQATRVPVKWMEKGGNVSEEIVQQLNAPEDTYVWANKRDAVNNYDGLNALGWVFGSLEGPDLYSDRGPRDRDSDWGALLGSRLSREEMIRNFDPSKVMSEYQLEMQNLENDFAELKKAKDTYDEKFESVEQRIAKLKKIKPE